MIASVLIEMVSALCAGFSSHGPGSARPTPKNFVRTRRNERSTVHMSAAAALPASELIPTRYSLLSRLHNWDDQKSWKDFFDTYWKFIYSVAVKSGLTNTEAQEVVQETIISVAKHIQKFEHSPELGSFKGWLRNIIRWRIADQFEKRSPALAQRDELAGGDPDVRVDLIEYPDPAGDRLAALWEEEWRNNLFEAAVQRVKQEVKEEHYVIFDLHVFKGWSALRVARALHVSIGKVYLIKHRLTGMIKREIKRLDKALT
jgi:RNA polymerase sigma factor (sigma-70 family)